MNFCISANSLTKKYECKTTHSATPFLKVNSSQYLDLTTNSTSGLQVKIKYNNAMYRPMQTYTSTSSRSSQYISTTMYSGYFSSVFTSEYSGISSRSSTSGYSGIYNRSSQYNSTSGYSGQIKKTITTYTRTQANAFNSITAVTGSTISYVVSKSTFTQYFYGSGSFNSATRGKMLTLRQSAVVSTSSTIQSASTGSYKESVKIQNYGAYTASGRPTYTFTTSGTLVSGAPAVWITTFNFGVANSSNTQSSATSYKYKKIYSRTLSFMQPGNVSSQITAYNQYGNAYDHVSISGSQAVTVRSSITYGGRYSGTVTGTTSGLVSLASWSSTVALTRTASRLSTYITSSSTIGSLSSYTALTRSSTYNTTVIYSDKSKISDPVALTKPASVITTATTDTIFTSIITAFTRTMSQSSQYNITTEI